MSQENCTRLSAILVVASLVMFTISGYSVWKAREIVDKAQVLEELSNKYLEAAQDEYRRALKRMEEVEEFYRWQEER